MKYMQGRKLRENYESSKESLLDYVKNHQVDPIEVMNRLGDLTEDEDMPREAYYLAKNNNHDNLVRLVKSL
jgi:hypothetical protein